MQSKNSRHESSTNGQVDWIDRASLVRDVLGTIKLLSHRYPITALDAFIESCRSFAVEEVLNVAVLGRFKTGKSSFLNRLLGRSVLPVGAIPVTAVGIGVPLRNTEMELYTQEPLSPDVRVGKIFDRNWELLSFIGSDSV